MKPYQEKLRSLGARVTPVRLGLLTLLEKHAAPLTAKEILDALKKKNLTPNKTTIYRELDFFTSQNLLQTVDLGDGQKRYELAVAHHHHVVCVKCKAINPVRLPCHLKKSAHKITRATGFVILNHSLEFFGLCRKCQ